MNLLTLIQKRLIFLYLYLSSLNLVLFILQKILNGCPKCNTLQLIIIEIIIQSTCDVCWKSCMQLDIYRKLKARVFHALLCKTTFLL